MPRTSRASVGDYCYHVINRGNARAEVFQADGDYQAFLDLLRHASQRIPMRILAYCLMPNHFHLTLWPYHDGGSQSMDVMAADGACPTVSHLSRLERPCVARAVQRVSHRTRRASAHRAALHRTQSGACELGPPRQGLAMVECPCVERVHAQPSYRSRTCRTTRAMAQLGERADDGHRDATDSTKREARCTIWIRNMGHCGGSPDGTRCEPATNCAATETRGNVECICFLYSPLRDCGARAPMAVGRLSRRASIPTRAG